MCRRHLQHMRKLCKLKRVLNCFKKKKIRVHRFEAWRVPESQSNGRSVSFSLQPTVKLGQQALITAPRGSDRDMRMSKLSVCSESQN